jgi:hypothetical protein
MLRYLMIFMMVVSSFSANANVQGGRQQHRFDPQKFENQLEQFVLQKMSLSQSESAAFIPIFREKRKEEVMIMENGRKSRRGRPATEKEWENVLKTYDNNEVKLKKIQQTYHEKMLKVIPASKIMKMIRAEEEFHREMFRKMQMRMAQRRKQAQHNK